MGESLSQDRDPPPILFVKKGYNQPMRSICKIKEHQNSQSEV